MTEGNKNYNDVHGTETTTKWIHRHRTLARWFMKLLIAGVASLLYYLRRQEKEIQEEIKKEK